MPRIATFGTPASSEALVFSSVVASGRASITLPVGFSVPNITLRGTGLGDDGKLRDLIDEVKILTRGTTIFEADGTTIYEYARLHGVQASDPAATGGEDLFIIPLGLGGLTLPESVLSVAPISGKIAGYGYPQLTVEVAFSSSLPSGATLTAYYDKSQVRVVESDGIPRTFRAIRQSGETFNIGQRNFLDTPSSPTFNLLYAVMMETATASAVFDSIEFRLNGQIVQRTEDSAHRNLLLKSARLEEIDTSQRAVVLFPRLRQLSGLLNTASNDNIEIVCNVSGANANVNLTFWGAGFYGG